VKTVAKKNMINMIGNPHPNYDIRSNENTEYLIKEYVGYETYHQEYIQ